jgi:hypothetical protein
MSAAATATIEKERGIGGRKPREILYTRVSYNAAEYIVGNIIAISAVKN